MAIHIGRVKPIRRHSKISTCYEIGQQADHHQLKRLLIEASVTSSLLCPINGYQHTFRCSVRSMVSPVSLPFDINTPLLLYPTDGYQHNIGTSTELRFSGRQMVYHIAISPKSRHALKTASRPPFGTPTDRSLCHIFVALSDQWISTHLSLLCT